MAKKKTKKKKKEPQYDENGRWTGEFNTWVNAIRRSFRQSPQMYDIYNNNRIEIDVYKKDGTLAKKKGIRYKCVVCGKLFMKTQCQIDHKNPVIETYVDGTKMLLDNVAKNIYCKLDNLQIVCAIPMTKLPKGQRSCHQIKSNEENFIRREFKKLREKGLIGDLPTLKEATPFLKEIEEKYKLKLEKQKLKESKSGKKVRTKAR